MALAGFFNALLAIVGLLAFGTLLGLAMIFTALKLSGVWGREGRQDCQGRGGPAQRQPSRKSETHSTIN
jgi:hypothetical protein